MKKIAKFAMAAILAGGCLFSVNAKEKTRKLTPAKQWTVYIPGKANAKNVEKDLAKSGWLMSNSDPAHFSLIDADINSKKVLKFETTDGKNDAIALPLSGNEKKVTVIFKAQGSVNPDSPSTPFSVFYAFVQKGQWQTLLRHNSSNQIKGQKNMTRLNPQNIVNDWHDYRFVFDVADPEKMTATLFIDGEVRHEDLCRKRGDYIAESDLGDLSKLDFTRMEGAGNYLEFGDNDGSSNAFGRYAYFVVVLDEDVSGMSLEEIGAKVGADLVTAPKTTDEGPKSNRPESKPAGINMQPAELGMGADWFDSSMIQDGKIRIKKLPKSRANASKVITETPVIPELNFAATVEPSGKDGAFKTISEAIEKVPEGSAIKVLPGFYYEKIKITKNGISLIGTNPATTVIYGYEADTGGIDGNLLVEVNLLPGATNTEPGVKAAIPEKPAENAYFNAANITFYNKGAEWNNVWGASERRSIALALKGVDKCYLENCIFLGQQDTLYWRSGRVYAKNCYIEGDVDYVCGGATVYFDNCQIHTIAYLNGGIIVAAAAADTGYKSTAEYANGYVFKNCLITAALDFKDQAKKITLGRGTWVGGSATAEISTGKTTYVGCEFAEKSFNEKQWNDWDSVNTAEKAQFSVISADAPEAAAYDTPEKVLGFVPELK